jgi:hypothetical protein
VKRQSRKHVGIPRAAGAALVAWATVSGAAVPPPGAATPPAAPAAAIDDEPKSSTTCTESFPPGSTKPKVVESFPDRGKSGYALALEVTIAHGKGETVLPSGLGSEGAPEQVRALESAGFYLPNAKSGAAPRLVREEKGSDATSKVTILVVTLPKKPGRNELTLPSLPIAMARASGEVRTLCTTPHAVTIEDPIANTANAAPKANPKPIRQVEDWTAAKNAAIGALAALVVGSLLAWLISLWRKRPRPIPPPPPPRPPWDVALEELFDVRIAQLVQQGRFAEHFDRVSDAVRRYLGARYGFDGLETTTREAMAALRRVSPGVTVMPDVETFLDSADLVKFAKLTPTEDECHDALGRAEDIVRRTMPAAMPTPATAVSTGAAPSHGSLDAKTGLPKGDPEP